MMALAVAAASPPELVPLAIVDEILLNFHVGHVLVAALVLTTLAVLPLQSGRILGINTALFGAIFVMTPFWVVDGYEPFLFGGIAMIFIGTMIVAFTKG